MKLGKRPKIKGRKRKKMKNIRCEIVTKRINEMSDSTGEMNENYNTIIPNNESTEYE